MSATNETGAETIIPSAPSVASSAVYGLSFDMMERAAAPLEPWRLRYGSGVPPIETLTGSWRNLRCGYKKGTVLEAPTGIARFFGNATGGSPVKVVGLLMGYHGMRYVRFTIGSQEWVVRRCVFEAQVLGRNDEGRKEKRRKAQSAS